MSDKYIIFDALTVRKSRKCLHQLHACNHETAEISKYHNFKTLFSIQVMIKEITVSKNTKQEKMSIREDQKFKTVWEK